MTMQGADPGALRDLAHKFVETAKKLDGMSDELRHRIASSSWTGEDAKEFRDAWRGEHSSQIRFVSHALMHGSKVLERQATEQEDASNSSGAWLDHAMSNIKHAAREWSDISWIKKTYQVGKGLFNAVNSMGLAKDFLAAQRAIGPAAESMAAFLANDVNKLLVPASKVGKFLGAAGGVAAIVGGIHDMINPEHDGWRGAGDRVAGGLSAFAGAVTVVACFTPVGPVIGAVALTAGLVAGAWQLGNTIYDNWDTISYNTSKFVSDFAKDPGGTIVNTGKAAWEQTKQAASSAWNFVKGIFS